MMTRLEHIFASANPPPWTPSMLRALEWFIAFRTPPSNDQEAQ